MMLFASDKVLISMQSFIEKPSKDRFLEIASAMRNDLGFGTKIKPTTIDKLK